MTELLSTRKDWVVGYHEHDSLLERRPEEDLSEEERKAAWEDYEKEKMGIPLHHQSQLQLQQPSIGGGFVSPKMVYQQNRFTGTSAHYQPIHMSSGGLGSVPSARYSTLPISSLIRVTGGKEPTQSVSTSIQSNISSLMPGQYLTGRLSMVSLIT